MNDALSTYHLSSIHRDYQPAKVNFFELIIEDFGDLLKPSVDENTASSEDYLTNYQESIRLTVSKFTPPSYELNDITVRKGNSEVHYAGTPTWSSSSLTVDDMIGAETKTILEALRDQAYDVQSDKARRASNYKHTYTVIEYTADHEKVRTYKLIGAWVKSVSLPEYDKTSDSLVEVSASIVYDRAYEVVE